MPADVSPDATVAFTVKELLVEQTGLLRQIDTKVDSKADKADLAPLMVRLDDHHSRIGRLEEADRARGAFGRRLWITVTAVVVPFGVALLLVLVR